MKLTPWFPPDVKPVRVGVYEKNLFNGRRWYSKWDGSQWLFICETADGAAVEQIPSAFINVPWRGIRGPA